MLERVWRKGNTLTLLVGMQTTTATLENSVEIPLKTGNRTALSLVGAVHGMARSRTQLSDFTFTFHFHALEKEMATHSSVLPWRVPGMGEPDGLPSMGSHRVGHD